MLVEIREGARRAEKQKQRCCFCPPRVFRQRPNARQISTWRICEENSPALCIPNMSEYDICTARSADLRKTSPNIPTKDKSNCDEPCICGANASVPTQKPVRREPIGTRGSDPQHPFQISGTNKHIFPFGEITIGRSLSRFIHYHSVLTNHTFKYCLFPFILL